MVDAGVDDKPVGALHAGGAVVVNCAAAAVLVPDEQLVVTLQLYKEAAVKPVRLADTAVCADEKTTHVEDEFNLYSTL